LTLKPSSVLFNAKLIIKKDITVLILRIGNKYKSNNIDNKS